MSLFKSPPELVIPPEWAPHKAIWTAWPSHPDLWQENLAGARAEVGAMIKALAPGDAMKVLACGEEAVESAEKAVGDVATVIPARFGDIWIRDTGPIFAQFDGENVALRFANNGWGGKYILPGDETIGDEIAKAAGVKCKRFDFVLEGGAVDHNGAGGILTTRQCMLNPNRNAGWSQPKAETCLRQALNTRRFLWLEEGLLNDHTDGHVDNLARFLAVDVALCQYPGGDDDPNAVIYAAVEQVLGDEEFYVQHVVSPGKVCNTDGDIMPASHMNFVIGNKTVVVPVYNEILGNKAVEAMKGFFPEREVIGLPSMHLLSGGGSFHCITQQEPAP